MRLNENGLEATMLLTRVGIFPFPPTVVAAVASAQSLPPLLGLIAVMVLLLGIMAPRMGILLF